MRWSLVLALHLAAAPALASSGDALAQFGMLGRVAVDCAAPPSVANPHQTISVDAKGDVTRTLRMNLPTDGTFPMWNVILVAPDRLQYEERSNNKSFTVTVLKIGNRFRSWLSVSSDGHVFIRDGKLGNGRETLSFEVCGSS